MFGFDVVSAKKKHLEIVTDFLNGRGILQICLLPLENILKSPTKLLFKLCFEDFRIFSRLY